MVLYVILLSHSVMFVNLPFPIVSASCALRVLLSTATTARPRVFSIKAILVGMEVVFRRNLIADATVFLSISGRDLKSQYLCTYIGMFRCTD